MRLAPCRAVLACSAVLVASPAVALTGDDAVNRALQWVNAGMPYCQVPFGSCDSHVCCGPGYRPENPDWDPYRSDCSGLVSWAWDIGGPGRVTTQFAPFDGAVSYPIDCSALQPGDALNSADHIMLFQAWVTPGQVAQLIDEHIWGTTAESRTFDVSCLGQTVVRGDWPSNPFTAIRFTGFSNTVDNCTGSEAQGCGNYGCGCQEHQCGGVYCPGLSCSPTRQAQCGTFGCNCANGDCNGGFCPGDGCEVVEATNCGKFGCGCVDHQCSGGYCPGTGCTALELKNCGAYGCGCVDHQCSGGYCPGTGCTAKETADCTAQGCGCTDHQCSGGACMGADCTAKEIQDCGGFGCDCADHQCSGAYCPGSGCTSGETAACDAQGCGCVDHTCSGGACPGSGCTIYEGTVCDGMDAGCSGGACLLLDAGAMPVRDGGHPLIDAGSPVEPGSDAGAPSQPSGFTRGDAGETLPQPLRPGGREAGCGATAGLGPVGLALAVLALARRRRQGT